MVASATRSKIKEKPMTTTTTPTRTPPRTTPPAEIAPRDHLTTEEYLALKDDNPSKVLATNDSEDVMFAFYGTDRLMFGEESKAMLNLKYGTARFIKRALPDSYIKSVMSRPL